MTDQVRRLEDLEEAPVLGVPMAEPDPVPNCARCHYWDRQRSAARAGGDWTRVSDCNVHIRRHPH